MRSTPGFASEARVTYELDQDGEEIQTMVARTRPGPWAACGRSSGWRPPFDPTQFATGEDVGEATLRLDGDTGVMLRYEARDPEGTISSLEAVEVGEPEASDFDLAR